jgi:hypothetical protein
MQNKAPVRLWKCYLSAEGETLSLINLINIYIRRTYIMGTKRVGWARIRSLINENQNQLKIRNDQVVAVSSDTTLTANQSGATIFWDASTSNTITLPAAATGLNFKIILKDAVNTDDAARITVTAGDCFYGVVTLTSATVDKVANQRVDYDTATGTPGSYDYLNFSPDAQTTGGASGDVLHITAVDGAAWHVRTHLTTTGNSPASVAAIGAS